ncbi:MAG: MmgE/PrpD family protein [Lactobacillus sp.]|jgi:2-methylcitrate dehydratase PrpD|nr:MmgE/PrpD family protein [Lactobacillus sp.]
MAKSVTNTTQVAQLLFQRPSAFQQQQLITQAKLCLLDDLAATLGARQAPALNQLKAVYHAQDLQLPAIGAQPAVTPDHVALLNGFSAHYLDIDDTNADLRGHPSAVIFASLFALTDGSETLAQLLWAAVVGIEFAGQCGRLLNPQLAFQGIHTTGAIGTLAAAAAIANYKQLTLGQTQALLSLAATQATALEIEAGSDGKPLNAGYAARNAVTAYQHVQAGLTASLDPFDNQRGWFHAFAHADFDPQTFAKYWLQPGEILTPGMWYKSQPFCSAAMSGFDAAVALRSYGIDLAQCAHIQIDFPENADHALRFTNPQTGQEGKFSSEYVVWLALQYDQLPATAFSKQATSQAFQRASHLFQRTHNLRTLDPSTRPTAVTVTTKTGRSLTIRVDYPKGSPQNPLDQSDLFAKFKQQAGLTTIESVQAFWHRPNNQVTVADLAQCLTNLSDRSLFHETQVSQ